MAFVTSALKTWAAKMGNEYAVGVDDDGDVNDDVHVEVKWGKRWGCWLSDQLLFARQPPNCIHQKVNLPICQVVDAARRSSGPAPDRWSCRPWPPTRRRRRAASTTAPACSGSGSASGARSRSYFAEFWTDKKGMKMDLHSFMYLDIEETDGTLYLSQIPSARSRSLKIIVIVNLVMLVVDILWDPSNQIHSSKYAWVHSFIISIIPKLILTWSPKQRFQDLSPSVLLWIQPPGGKECYQPGLPKRRKGKCSRR